MSLSNSISLIADKYYTIDEDTGQLIDITTLIKTSATILDKEILDRKADKTDVATTLNSKLNISTFDNFKDNILNISFNTKLNISDYNTTTNNIISNINNTFLTKLNITDYNTTTNNIISNINNTFLTKLNISDYNATTNNIISNINNTFLTKLNITDYNATTNNIISNINNTFLTKLNITDYNTTTNNIINNINTTFLNKLDVVDYNATTNNIISNINNTLNTKLSVVDYNATTNNIISNINNTFNTKLNITDFNITNTANLNNINSRVLTADYDLYKTETAANLATKVNILDYNANNIILGTQIATKLNISTFDLFKIENTTNLNTKLSVVDYNATHQTIINLIDSTKTDLTNFQNTAYTMLDERSGVFYPQPPLYFSLNILGETPRMELVLSENEVTQLTNFNNKTDITTFLNLYDTTITTDSKLSIINNSINQRISQTTLTSTLSNYMAYNPLRSNATVKSIDMSSFDYIKFEGGGITAAIDRTGYFGYPNSVVAPKLSTENIYLSQNIYLKDASKIYLDDLETKYLTMTNLSHLQTSTSNIQTQINDINITVNTKLSVVEYNATTNNIISDINNTFNTKLNVVDYNATTNNIISDINNTFNTKLNVINYATSSTIDVTNDYLSVVSSYPSPTIKFLMMSFNAKNLTNQNYTQNTVFIQRSNLEHVWINKNIWLNDAVNIYAAGLNISPFEISYLDGCTSNLQTQINNINNSSNIIQTINDAATSLNMFNCSVASNIYINNTALINIRTSEFVSDNITGYELSTLQYANSNIQNQIDNNLSTLTTAINLRINWETLTSTLTDYYDIPTIDTKLTNTLKYDTIRSIGNDKVINLSGLSSLSYDTYYAPDLAYKKDVYYDISNSGSYTRNTFFSKYHRSNQLWVEGDLRLNSASFVYLNNPLTTNKISTTELYCLANVSSNIQTQINTKAPINNPTFTGTVAGITKAHVGLGNVDNTADTSKPISTAMQTALDLKAPINNPSFSGVVTYSRCSGRILGNASLALSCGIIDITTANINQTSTGVYVITMPSAHPSGTNYAVIGSVCPASGAPGFFTGIVNSSTQFTCYIYNSAGSANSYHFNFMTIP